MKKMLAVSTICTTLSLSAFAVNAHATPLQCKLPTMSPTSAALPLSAIAARLEAQGYGDIRKLERKGICYKASVRTDAGKLSLYLKRSDGEIIRREEND